ncbi:efflux RND transporter periplasmic adaptor subunit [Acaryochloris sp. IP29b_bin.137]|uniref:efflux RND transporter periplasmic adaptor subunit n=1 Tax=Acaryochloris sp. IP29b_bin.137 TaxID=2969217 RepID=UPI00261BA2DC|nr:efflux RND transporter periplasmic adaptor subunit [Acaryochloris sp. IP29b_bin.137]
MFKKVDCQMEARTGIAIALLLVGCAQPQVENKTAEPIVAVSPTVAPRPARQQRNTPRRLKLRLTLDRPEDLKVKVGDSVVKGQVISHRPSVRAKLIQEREILQQQLKQLSVQTITPSDAVEKAEVEQARLQVERARVAISNFHADSPWTEYARRVLVLPDHSQLRSLESEYQSAKGEFAIAVTRLQEAQQLRAVKPDILAKRAELLGKIRETERQLSLLGVVRSPYDGAVQSFRWLGQVNQEIQAELTLNVESKSSELPSNRQVN